MTDKAVPTGVQQLLERLGADLALARRRRRISTASMAQRLRVSSSTLRRLERGDPTVAMGTLASALFVLGAAGPFGSLLATERDELGLQLMDEAVPQRIRKKKLSGAR